MATITRCLKQLQLGPEQINKSIKALNPVLVVVGANTAPVGYASQAEYIKATEDTLNSVFGQVDNQVKLAEAVARINATTMVVLKGCPGEVSIAGAVKLRQAIKTFIQPLATSIQAAMKASERVLDAEELRYQARLDDLLSKLYGKDARTRGEDSEALTADFRKKQGPTQVRGVNQRQMDLLMAKLALIGEIDLVLSETNGKVDIAAE